jgi:hypothetical protein
LRISSAVVLWLIFALPLSGARVWQANVHVSTVDEIKAEFASVPCSDKDRYLAARAVFERMGVPATDLSEDTHKNVKNLVIRKAGASSETIVVGAHYDKVSAGCGLTPDRHRDVAYLPFH